MIIAVIYLMTKLKKAYEGYRSLGSNTRLIIRITLILFFTLILASAYTLTATHAENHYELLLLTDGLVESAKSVSGIGFIGMLIVGVAEGKEQ